MNRLVNFDLIKVLSIFGVVYIHSNFLFGCSNDVTKTIAELFRIAVPLFIIIWAYFLSSSYNKKTDSDKFSYILSKVKHLFIVFSIWSIMYFLLFADWDKISLPKIITMYFTGYGWSGQYYFIVLFQLLLFFPLLEFIYKKKMLLLLSLLIVFAIYLTYNLYYEHIPNGILKLGDRPFIYWLPYVFMGIHMAKVKIQTHIGWFICACIFISMIPLDFNLFNTNSAYIKLSVLFSSILLSYYILNQPSFVLSNSMYQTINYVGSRTMIIFVLNPLIIYILNKLDVNLAEICQNTVFNFTLHIAVTIFIIASALLFNKLIEKTGLSKILT